MGETGTGYGIYNGTRPGGHPTIGLLTARVSDELGSTFWRGALDATREQGANLLAFAGGILNSPHGFEARANVLYDLVGAENVDGLVIDGGLLSHYVGREALQNFCERYRDLPMGERLLPRKRSRFCKLWPVSWPTRWKTHTCSNRAKRLWKS